MASEQDQQNATGNAGGTPQGAPQLSEPRALALMDEMSGSDWQGELEYPLLPGQAGFRVRTGPAPLACLLVWVEPQMLAESLAMGRRAWGSRHMLGNALSLEVGWGDPQAVGFAARDGLDARAESDARVGSDERDGGDGRDVRDEREEFARCYAFARAVSLSLARAGMEPFCLPQPWHPSEVPANAQAGEWIDELHPGQGALLAARVLLRPTPLQAADTQAGLTAQELAANPEALVPTGADEAYSAWRASMLEQQTDGAAATDVQSRARAEARRELALDALADVLGLQPEMGDLADALGVASGVSLGGVTQALDDAGLMPLAFELALRQRARRWVREQLGA